MTENLSKQQILDYQEQVTLFAQLVSTFNAEAIRAYLEQTRHQADGTMDAIIPHFMSLTDMNKGKRNLTFLREMGQHILATQQTVKSFIEQEAA